MNPRYRYYLDGTVYDDPIGWDGWVTKLIRDQNLRGIVQVDEGKVTFTGDAYAYIQSRREEGFCASIQVRIDEDCSRNGNFITAFEGNIFLSDVIFDITNCSCECDIEDDSYFARIANNKQIEISIGAGKSKNGSDIDIPSLYDVQMFNPCDGVDSGLPKPKAYRAYDIARYMIQFMSDGRMEFQSTALDSGDFEGVLLTKGLLMADPSNDDKGIIFKWEEFLRNICNICNLSWQVKKISGAWTFILEKDEDTFTTAISADFNNVERIRRQIDTARNYAAVELGSDDIIESLGCGVLGGAEPAFPDQINMLGVKREQFAVTGTCNIDSVLDLTTDWVISSNVIENIYFNGDTGYDSDPILLHCASVDHTLLTAAAIKGDVFGTTPPVYYNTAFYNYEVVKRHLRGIPSGLVKYLNAPDTGFKAKNTMTETITFPPTVVSGALIDLFPYPFGEDYSPNGYDLNNDYGNGTTPGNLVTQVNSRYDAPFDNVYKFRVTMDLEGSSTIYNITVFYQRYDSALNLLATYPVNIQLSAGNYYGVEFDSPLIFMNATDVMAVRIRWEFYPPSIGATFELIGTGTSGGVFEIFNSEDYIADLYSFSVPMSMAEFRNIQQNVTDKITADDGKNQISGWVDTITYNRHTNIAEITLITNGR